MASDDEREVEWDADDPYCACCGNSVDVKADYEFNEGDFCNECLYREYPKMTQRATAAEAEAKEYKSLFEISSLTIEQLNADIAAQAAQIAEMEQLLRDCRGELGVHCYCHGSSCGCRCCDLRDEIDRKTTAPQPGDKGE